MSALKDDRVAIARLLSQVMDTQQQSIIQFNNMSVALESIRAEIRRTDENHAREVDRLHEIINKLLPAVESQTMVSRYGPEVVTNVPTEIYLATPNPTATVQRQQLHAQQKSQLAPITPVPTSTMPQIANLLGAPVKHHMSPAESTTPTPSAKPAPVLQKPLHESSPIVVKKEPIDSSKEISSDSSDGEPWEQVQEAAVVTSRVKQEAPFGARFTQKPGQWECRICYVINEAATLQCMACGSNEDGTSSGTKTLETAFSVKAPLAPSKFNFGLTKPITSQKTSEKVSFADAAKVTAEQEPAPNSASGSSKDPAKFSFGQAGASSSDTIFGGKPTATKPIFSFSTSNGGGTTPATEPSLPSKIFGSSATPSTFTLAKVAAAPTLFDEESKKQAQENLAKQKSSKFGMNVLKTESKQDDEEEESEEYEPDIVVKPIYPLPDLIEAVTGEENEKIEFHERCKLYRWANDTKEWKERGAGEMKILVNEQGKARCVMRREQTLKLACNFRILSGMKIDKMPKNEKACFWFCVDFSEETSTDEKLSARFGSVEKAGEFKKKFDEYCK